MLVRCNKIDLLLEKSNLMLNRRLVLDIGCNLGMMICYALKRGAFWTLGWDKPELTGPAEKILYLLGNSRFDLYGRALRENYPIEKDIPERLKLLFKESVIFYLAMREHIGILESLKKTEWRALVYEAHQKDSEDVIEKDLQLLSRNECTIIRDSYRDGDSGVRKIAILLRN